MITIQAHSGHHTITLVVSAVIVPVVSPVHSPETWDELVSLVLYPRSRRSSALFADGETGISGKRRRQDFLVLSVGAHESRRYGRRAATTFAISICLESSRHDGRGQRNDHQSNIHPIKVALTEEQAERFDLPKDMRARKTSSSYKKFKK